jgi:hypothetical protein
MHYAFAAAVATLGVLLAAYAIWLTVRIVNHRKKPMALVRFVVLVLYPMSVGPITWLWVHVLPKSSISTLNAVYRPLEFTRHIPPVASAIMWYQHLWASETEVSMKQHGPE